MEVLAAVTSNWVILVLIAMSCLSLILASWCALFRASERKLGEEMLRVGGAIDGLDGRLSEILQQVSKKTDDIELRAHSLISQTRDSLVRDLKAAEGKAEQALAAAQAFQEAAEQFRAAQERLEALSALPAEVAGLRETLGAVQTSMGRLDKELKASVKQQVDDSFQQLDATILAVLETIQGEMLRGVDRIRDIQDVVAGRTVPEPARRHEEEPVPEIDDTQLPESPDNIIVAEPLFACVSSRSEPPVDDEGPEAEPEVAFMPAELTLSATTEPATTEPAEAEPTVSEAPPAQAETDSEAEASDDVDPADVIQRLGLFEVAEVHEDEDEENDLL